MSVKRSGRAGPAQWAGLAVLALPTVLLGLDLTVLHLALPSLAMDLSPSGTQELWIVDAYGFLIAGFLITMGTLGDRIGRRRLLMIGGVAFIAASIAAAYSPTAEILIASRAALGIAGATLMPSTLALISNMFHDPRQRALAIGLWATFFAGGMAAGPLVGGVLLHYFWWGAAFLIAVPIIGLMLLLAPVLLPEYRAPQSGRFDLPSVFLSLLALLPVVYAIKEFAKAGPTLPVIAAALVGAVFSVVFVRRQLFLESPLLDMGLFRNRAFSVALGVMLVGLVGVGGTMLLTTQYLQLIEGLTPPDRGPVVRPARADDDALRDHRTGPDPVDPPGFRGGGCTGAVLPGVRADGRGGGFRRAVLRGPGVLPGVPGTGRARRAGHRPSGGRRSSGEGGIGLGHVGDRAGTRVGGRDRRRRQLVRRRLHQQDGHPGTLRAAGGHGAGR
ncbi:hypothetical protein GCM10027590_35430 [Nocardiopsis nanhaiensis]